MRVLKRDKTVEVFQYEKLINAVEKAFQSCGSEIPTDISDKVNSLYDENNDIVVDVEEIQDKIENLLITHYPQIAKCYIIYRYNHKVIRESRDKLMKGITKKLMAEDIENQNGNRPENERFGKILFGVFEFCVNRRCANPTLVGKSRRRNGRAKV